MYTAVRRAIITMFIVGPILILINQKGALFGDEAFNWVNAILTFIVPFSVSFVSSYLTGREQENASLSQASQHVSAHQEVAKESDNSTHEMNPASSPDSNINQEAIQAASSIVVTVKDNARKVNSSSKERKQHIQSAIEFAEGFVEKLNADVNSFAGDISMLEETSNVAHQASSLVKNNRDAIGAANTTRQEAELAVSELEKSFGQISEMTAKIAEISSRTNLLALNAAIEAARAGDAGRGFNIVANEVKSLSQSSANAADDIRKLILELGSSTQAMSEKISVLGTSLDAAMSESDEIDACAQRMTETVGVALANIMNTSESSQGNVQKFSRLLQDFKSLKIDTDAAIRGSSTNIALTEDVLKHLKSVG